MVWLWIILGVIGLAGFGHFLSIAASRKADRIMKGMERQYEGFIEVLFANVYLKDKNWEEYNQEEIKDEVVGTSFFLCMMKVLYCKI